MPKMAARAPPLNPGKTAPMPMKIPFMKLMIDFFKISNPLTIKAYAKMIQYRLKSNSKDVLVVYKWTYQTEIGPITIGANDHSITYLKTSDTCVGELKETELIKNAYLQLAEYLSGNRQDFDLPLEPGGTKFQQDVWLVSCQIPYGQTTTYKKLAELIGRPKAIRAVGAANGQNSIYIIIPCHRVIGSNGSLTGYGGGLDTKEKLLRLEGAKF